MNNLLIIILCIIVPSIMAALYCWLLLSKLPPNKPEDIDKLDIGPTLKDWLDEKEHDIYR